MQLSFFYFAEQDKNKATEKVGADIFKNCNQKCQEGVSSKTHCQGMDIGYNSVQTFKDFHVCLVKFPKIT